MTRNTSALVALVLLALSAVACAAPTASSDTTEAAETGGDQQVALGRAVFDTVQGLDGSFRFRVRAPNGSMLLVSRAFADAVSAGSAIDALVTFGNDHANFEVVAGPAGFTFDVKTPETKEVLASSDPYTTRQNAERGVTTVRALIRLEQQARVEATTAARDATSR